VKLYTALLMIIMAAIAAFAALNWNVFIKPTDLSLGVANVQMPLGLVMLGLCVFVTALFLVFAAFLQASALLEIRRHTRELRASRELADQAEASRLTELRKFLEDELLKQANLNKESHAEGLARINQLEQDLRVFIEQSDNTLAAYIGELDDRLEKTTTPSNDK